jgi:hypothetical protein
MQRLADSRILHRKRRWIRGKKLFKQAREEEFMLATSGSSVAG